MWTRILYFLTSLLIMEVVAELSQPTEPQKSTSMTNVPSPMKPADDTLGKITEKLLTDFLTDDDDDDDENTRRLEECSLSCQNNGVCRWMSTSSQPMCVCPFDYVGKYCETKIKSPMKDCTHNLCKHSGKCAKTSEGARCDCLPSFSGIYCERYVQSFKIKTQLKKDGQEMLWNDSYLDHKSQLYQKMSQDFKTLLTNIVKQGPDLLFVRAFHNCSDINFFEGSVLAEARLEFETDPQSGGIYDGNRLSQHLQRGADYEKRISPRTLSTTFNNTNDVQTEDVCKSGRQDCSPYAYCVRSTKETFYTCVCSPLTTDYSPYLFEPGRVCAYDGVIIIGFALSGIILCTLIILLGGCRKTIWYRYRKKTSPERVTFVQMPSDYEI